MACGGQFHLRQLTGALFCLQTRKSSVSIRALFGLTAPRVVVRRILRLKAVSLESRRRCPLWPIPGPGCLRRSRFLRGRGGATDKAVRARAIVAAQRKSSERYNKVGRPCPLGSQFEGPNPWGGPVVPLCAPRQLTSFGVERRVWRTHPCATPPTPGLRSGRCEVDGGWGGKPPASHSHRGLWAHPIRVVRASGLVRGADHP